MKKLKQHLDELNKIVATHPEALELEVITSKDDEGNGYNYVHYSPSIGLYEDGEFESEFYGNGNSVCLN